MQAKLIGLVLAGLVMSTNAYAANAPNAPVSTNLRCFLTHSATVPSTDYLSLWGATTYAHIGFSRNFGGIAVELILGDATNTHVQVLESRSGAGAAWQFAGGGYLGVPLKYENNQWIKDYDHASYNVLMNQGGGNARTVGNLGTNPYQWTYSVNLVATGTSVRQSDWTPLWLDTVSRNGTVTSASPCEPFDAASNPNAFYDYGSLDSFVAPVATNFGTAMRLDMVYNLKAANHQNAGVWNTLNPGNYLWDQFSFGLGLYFNKAIAKAYDLKMYFVKADINDPQVFIEVSPYNDFTLPPQYAWRSIIPIGETHVISENKFSYVAFIWTLPNPARTKVGFAVPYREGGQFRNEKTTYCSDPGNDQCGSLMFGINLSNPGPATNITYPPNQVRMVSKYFWFGDFSQLVDLIERNR